MPELAPQDIKPTAAWQDAWDGYALELELLGRSRSTISSRKSNVLAMARYFTAKGTEPEDVVAMEEPEGGWKASHYGWTSQGGWPSREAFGRFMRGEAPLISRNAPFPVAVPAAEPGQKTAPEPARPARRVPTSTGWAMVFGQPPESSGEPPLAPSQIPACQAVYGALRAARAGNLADHPRDHTTSRVAWPGGWASHHRPGQPTSSSKLSQVRGPAVPITLRYRARPEAHYGPSPRAPRAGS